MVHLNLIKPTIKLNIHRLNIWISQKWSDQLNSKTEFHVVYDVCTLSRKICWKQMIKIYHGNSIKKKTGVPILKLYKIIFKIGNIARYKEVKFTLKWSMYKRHNKCRMYMHLITKLQKQTKKKNRELKSKQIQNPSWRVLYPSLSNLQKNYVKVR